MNTQRVDVDYLIIGAGSAGMAFADTLLSESDATMAIVDRRHCPGGHWNDAYPFVRLHQPSHFYGVESRPLGSGAVDTRGSNEGLHELASGAEVLAYFDMVMRQRFLRSGRVKYMPMSTVVDGNTVLSLLSAERHSITAGKVVDAAYLSPTIPATTPLPFPVVSGVLCVPIGELPKNTRPGACYVVVGAGKTGIDACLWLLENGTAPEKIRWIMPRDAWMYDRAYLQPGRENLVKLLKVLADQAEGLAEAESVDDAFVRLESKGAVLRLDSAVKPTMHHCAVVTRGELDTLRRIRNIVRMGRVKGIEPHRVILDRGELHVEPGTVFVNCTAMAFDFRDRPPLPIFAGNRITLQWTRNCAPPFSASLIAHVEATCTSDSEKNALCPVVPTPTDPLGWLRIMFADLPKEAQWLARPELKTWLANSRLNVFQGLASLVEPTPEEAAEFDRYARNVERALANIEVLLGSTEDALAN